MSETTTEPVRQWRFEELWKREFEGRRRLTAGRWKDGAQRYVRESD
ncbi:MAG: hypothetical protein ACOCR6_03050 [archaeon]